MVKIVTSHGGGSEAVSPNETVGGEPKIGQKKCHVLFEWPLL